MQVVPYSEWLSALVDAAEHEDTADHVPAVKLVPFLSDIGAPGAKRPDFSTSASREKSELLRDLGPVSLPWVRAWLPQWQIDDL